MDDSSHNPYVIWGFEQLNNQLFYLLDYELFCAKGPYLLL